MENLHSQNQLEDILNYDTIDGRIRSLSAIADTSTLSQSERVVSFSRGERFQERLTRYRNEVMLRLGKRKLTSKPRYLSSSRTMWNQNDCKEYKQIKYHDLEGLLGAYGLTKEENEDETEIVLPVVPDEVISQLDNLNIDELGKKQRTNGRTSSTSSHDEFYNINGKDQSNQSRSFSSIDDTDVVVRVVTSGTPTLKESPGRVLTNPRRRSSLDFGKFSSSFDSMPRIPRGKRNSLNVVQLSPGDARFDSSLKNDKSIKELRRRQRRAKKGLNGEGELKDWFGPEDDEDDDDEEEGEDGDEDREGDQDEGCETQSEVISSTDSTKPRSQRKWGKFPKAPNLGDIFDGDYSYGFDSFGNPLDRLGNPLDKLGNPLDRLGNPLDKLGNPFKRGIPLNLRMKYGESPPTPSFPHDAPLDLVYLSRDKGVFTGVNEMYENGSSEENDASTLDFISPIRLTKEFSERSPSLEYIFSGSKSKEMGFVTVNPQDSSPVDFDPIT